MAKKILKIIGATIASALALLILTYILQTLLLKRSLENKWLTAESIEFKNYQFVRCNRSILNPKVAFVDDYILLGDIEGLEMHFYTQVDVFDFSRDSWADKNYTGGTTIENTTFPELVRMVKDDCEQFKGPKGDLHDETINWSYYEHDAEAEKRWKESEEVMSEKLSEADELRLALDAFLPPKAKERIRELYGDWHQLPDEEVVKWFNDEVIGGNIQRIYDEEKERQEQEQEGEE